MLRTEVTVGGCCWAVETTIRRSLFYEVNAKILCFCGQRSHPQVFTGRSLQQPAPPIILATSRQLAASFFTQLAGGDPCLSAHFYNEARIEGARPPVGPEGARRGALCCGLWSRVDGRR